jgi:GntR family transcriptional regulator
MVKEGPKSPPNGDQIDRDSFEPVYAQLANIIMRLIEDGTFRPGDQLPSEAQLCRRYEISPMTVRRSINILADQGLVSTAQGRGTYVNQLTLSKATFQLTELERLLTDGVETDIKLLDVRVVSADDKVARKLGIKSGESTIYIRRLLKRDGKPVFYHRAYLIYDPKRPIVEAELDVTSLLGLFSQSDNALLKHGEINIEAAILNDEEGDLLGCTPPAAAFILEHIFYGFDNKPISWGWFIFRSDQLRFSTHIGIGQSGKE